ncbi:hypothetical protein F5148DRAFT_1324351 [Russula earlei]|uniref:Uncharacterized protein n=1 Tax=Russula earlei TaxID=71964 RepID=A0ACC0U1T6_9AGAM|nr:hypothetical protein F5148DRAFT_1324351 [Russula earlei]
MSSPQSQDPLAPPNTAKIPSLVSSIVLKARESDSLTSLTPRLVRSEVEKKMGIPSGTLDSPTYKALVKRAISDAINLGKTPEVNTSLDGKMKKNVSKPEVGERRRSNSKSIKSKETITDSEREDEPKLSAFGLRVKSDTRADIGEGKLVRSNPKALSSKVDPKTSKDTSQSTKAVRLEPKRKPPPAQQAQSDFDAENSDMMPRATSSSHRMTDRENSEAEKPRAKLKRPKQISHTLSKDEETIKRLKSLVVACGVRKQWARELDGLNANAQITYIRKILRDLGMVGRLSLEQAREIRARRELAQELDDVQKFERAIVSGKPFKTESASRRVAKSGNNADDAYDSSDSGSKITSDHERPQVNNARRSIMAFLQDQSSDED